MDLNGGLGEPPPSHAAQAVAALPRAEDFLDAASDAMDRLVPGTRTREGLRLVTPPHIGGDDAGRAALGPHRVAEMTSAMENLKKSRAPADF